jgi:hypothetical protein
MWRFSRKIIVGTVSTLSIRGLYGLYKMHQKLKAKAKEGDIYIGQYSIIHQVLELSRAGLVVPPATIYAIEHFTQRAHPKIVGIAQWGQKPFETPFSMESSLAMKNVNNDEYLTFKDVIDIRNEAIEELKERGFSVVKVKEIKKITIDNKRNEIHVEFNEGYNTHSLEAFVFNSATKPRENRRREFKLFKNSEKIYQHDPVEKNCPKIVDGLGLSALWVKEHCHNVQVLFCSKNMISNLERFKDNPRNKKVIDSITSDHQIDSRFIITNGRLALELDDSESWHINLKSRYKKFAEEYKHLQLEPENIALVIDDNKECIMIGEGINAIGYEANLDITKELPPEKVLNLHILPEEVRDLSISPKTIQGSVMHNLDFQRMLLADFFEKRGMPWSLEDKMILMPLERLFLRVKDHPLANAHAKIFTDYLKKYSELQTLPPDFFDTLKDRIQQMDHGPRTPKDATKILVEIFKKTQQKPSDSEVQNFEKVINELMDKKQDKLAIPAYMRSKRMKSPK